MTVSMRGPRLSQRAAIPAMMSRGLTARYGAAEVLSEVAASGGIPSVFREDSAVMLPGMRQDDAGYNFLSDSQNLGRDLPGATQDRQIRLSFLLYRSNAMAKRLVEMEVAYIIGNGITVSSKDTAVRDVLLAFWTNAYNDWPMHITQRIRDLIIYGEWFHLPNVNPTTGDVFINTVQPNKIEGLVPLSTNHEVINEIVLKQSRVNGTVQAHQKIRAIRPSFDPAAGFLDDANWSGDAFVFGINRTTDSLRGIGELFPLIDYIDLYDEMLFNRAEGVAARNSIYWDLTLEGYTERQIQDYLDTEVSIPPRHGTVWGHNERATLTAAVPNTNAADHVEDANLLRTHIIGTGGWPDHFMGDGGGTGRATAAEMSEPAYKNVILLQNQVRAFLTYEMKYVLFWAKRAGQIDPETKLDDFYISFGRPSTRDIARIGPAMFRIGQFIDISVKNGTLSRENGVSIIAQQINQMELATEPITTDLPVMDALTKKIVMPTPPAPVAAGPASGPAEPRGATSQGPRTTTSDTRSTK